MSFSPIQLLRPVRLPEGIHAELIHATFSISPSIIVFLISQVVVGGAIFAETGDIIVLALTVASFLIGAERMLMVRRYHRAGAATPLSLAEIDVWAKRFTIRSVASGIVVSAMGVRCFMLPEPTVHMLMIGALFAYGAGIITRVSYRPRLALLNLLIVSIPQIIACLLHGGAIYVCLGLTMVVFLFGAFEVVQHTYETVVSQLTLKRRFAGLAQRDALTGLSNRLGLAENLETVIADAGRSGNGLAVHSLDLDRFKAANDLYGHPAGDAVLKQVAQRLSRLTRASDLLVRLGGDEFVLVQTGITTREQATALASRIVEDIGSYYDVKGYKIEIGTSVGVALMSNEELTPDELLGRADQALYQAKRARSGFTVYTVAPQLVPAVTADDRLQDIKAVAKKTVNLR